MPEIERAERAMSLKRRMKRAVEKEFERGELAFANGYEITYLPIRDEWYSRLPAGAKAAIPRLHAAIQEDVPSEATMRELERLVEQHPSAARALLGPRLELRALYPGRKRYHVSEFAAYYGLVAQYEISCGNPARAQSILDLLLEAAPDAPATRRLADMLELPVVLGRLAGLGRLLGR